MNILGLKKVAKKDYDHELRYWTFPVRLDYPCLGYCFGEVAEEIPNYLLKHLYNLKTDYFNLSKTKQAGNQTIYLSYEDCMHLARLFTQFRESPVSEFQNNVMYGLLDDFKGSSENHQKEIIIKYFGQAKIEELSTDKYPKYYGLKELFRDEIAGSTLDIALQIEFNEYGKDIINLTRSNWAYDKAMELRPINGIPSLITASNDIINIALDTDKEKILVLNSCYNDGGPNWNGPGNYRAVGEPTVITLFPDRLSRTGGIVHY